MLALALAIAVAAVALGAALGLVGRGVSAAVGPVRTFALISALVVVLLQLLPEACAELGVTGLGVFLIALALPSVLGHAGTALVARRRARTGRPPSLGLELGYWGLVVHKLGDGLGLGAFAGPAHFGHAHVDLFVAISVHSVPLTALVVLAYRSAEGIRGALLRASGLAVATVAGALLSGTIPAARIDPFEPWIAAAVAGLLLHVVAHDFQPGVAPTTTSRLLDVAAIGAGLALAAMSGDIHAHGADGAGVRGAATTAFVELTLTVAPTLLAGLAAAAALQSVGGRRPLRAPGRGATFAQAARGAVLGAPMPICTCGVLPWADTLRRRGAATALVVAFLISTPELGLETLGLTVRLLGWPFAAVRLLGALGLAVVAAAAASRVAGPGPQRPLDVPPLDREGELGWPRLFADHFETLLYHVGPWTLVGLIAAAYLQAVLPPDAFADVAGSGFDVLGVAAVAVPTYVCAASATPLAYVLVREGLSPGAALVGMLLGPATNLATIAFLGRSFGGRAAAATVTTLVGAALALAYGVNAAALPITPVGAAPAEVVGSTLAVGSAMVLGALVGRSIWRDGVQAWLGSLGVSLAADERGDASGHGHGHGHEHGG